MSDITDLHGVYPTALRWNAETGALGYSAFDPVTGERTVELIELGSSQAKFALDYSCRERGYILIRQGLYDAKLTPVGSPPPAEPDDDNYKPGLGIWCWNPLLGQLRLETAAVQFRDAIVAVWDRVRTFKEAAEGKEPIIWFIDRAEVAYPKLGKTFFKPIIDIVGFVVRGTVPPFALREPTVKPPPAIDSQISFTRLEPPRREAPMEVQQRLANKLGGTAAPRAASTKRGTKQNVPLERGEFSDLLDDEIPDLVRDK
jgi:hypothetical protein